MHINIVHLGTVPYALGLDLQREVIAARKQGTIAETLLLLEHKPVITLGRSAKRHNVIASDELLQQRGVELFECDRGGDVTFHGPGQLVGYPIFDLFSYEPRIGAVEFMRRLEEVLIRSCADFGIVCQRVPGLTGVWTQPGSPLRRGGAEQNFSQPLARSFEPQNAEDLDQRLTTNDQRPTTLAKIAAMGIHISRGITSHGFALNVNTDLDYFNLIVPCGIVGKPVTSIQQELGAEQPIERVAEVVSRHFGQVFGRQVLWLDTIDALFGRKVGVPLTAPAELRAIAGDEVQSA
jgi:lipoyl(octanoyl) transferase